MLKNILLFIGTMWCIVICTFIWLVYRMESFQDVFPDLYRFLKKVTDIYNRGKHMTVYVVSTVSIMVETKEKTTLDTHKFDTKSG